MTEIPGKAHSRVTAVPPVGKVIDAKGAVAGAADPGAATATPQIPEPTNDRRSLKIAAAKAADPFFSGRKHFPELDGLRGLAIMLVLLCHYFYWLIAPATNMYRKVALAFLGKAGDWGVTLFFVLSGFLITGILYDSKGQDRYFRNFYARRFLRIFPLYYGFLAVMFLVLAAIRVGAPRLYSHSQTPQLLWSYQPWLWTYTANIWMFFHSGMVVIGHFWSLCVEEQFYLVWPLVIFLAPDAKWVIRVCWLAILAAVVIGVGVQSAGNSNGWLFTPVRMDALAAGGVVAVLLRDPGWHRRLSGLGPRFLAVGLGLWIVSDGVQNILRRGFHIAKPSHGIGPVAAFDLIPNFRMAVDVFIFVSLLLLAIFPSAWLGLPGKFYRMGWLRWLGRYSYGIYVYHFPIWVFSVMYLQSRGQFRNFCRSLPLAGTLVGLNIFAALSLAYASYHLYEKHFLKLKKYFPEQGAAATNSR